MNVLTIKLNQLLSFSFLSKMLKLFSKTKIFEVWTNETFEDGGPQRSTFLFFPFKGFYKVIIVLIDNATLIMYGSHIIYLP